MYFKKCRLRRQAVRQCRASQQWDTLTMLLINRLINVVCHYAKNVKVGPPSPTARNPLLSLILGLNWSEEDSPAAIFKAVFICWMNGHPSKQHFRAWRAREHSSNWLLTWSQTPKLPTNAFSAIVSSLHSLKSSLTSSWRLKLNKSWIMREGFTFLKCAKITTLCP